MIDVSFLGNQLEDRRVVDCGKDRVDLAVRKSGENAVSRETEAELATDFVLPTPLILSERLSGGLTGQGSAPRSTIGARDAV